MNIEEVLKIITKNEENPVVEVRIIKFRGKSNASGYFDSKHFNIVENLIKKYNESVNIYVTVQDINSDLLARSENKILEYAETATTDNDVKRYRWLIIDIDPIRPSGISASTAEKENARNLIKDVYEKLKLNGFSEPIKADSGNGYHLLYPVNFEATKQNIEIVKNFLKALSMLFSNEKVDVDTTVFNPSRILKLYGTVARKGDNTADRPHRKSNILSVPSEFIDVSIEEIKKIADLLNPVSPNKSNKPTEKFELDNFVSRNLDLEQIENCQDGTRYKLKTCPFDSNHVNSSAVFNYVNGAIGFKCFHNSCQNNKWQDVREKFEPNYREKTEEYKPKIVTEDNTLKTLSEEKLNHDTVYWQNFKDIPNNSVNKIENILDFNFSDVGNAKRLCKSFGSNIRYNFNQKKWYAWNNKLWKIDQGNILVNMAENVLKELQGISIKMEKELKELALKSPEKDLFSNKESDESKKQNLVKSIRAFVLKSENNNRVMAMIKLAQNEKNIPIAIEDMDKDIYLLNCQNGIIDLKTGELLKHDKNKYMTRISPVAYDPQTKCPKWLEFLDKIFEKDIEIIDYVQKMIGYSMSGDVGEQCLFILHGSGANGKSTLLETISYILNDYCNSLKANSLMKRRNDEGARGDLAKLVGIRFVTSTELNGNESFDESLVKSLISGNDTVPVRFLFQEEFNLKAVVKLWIGTNEKPKITGTNAGIWRRFRIIPFNYRFTEEEKVKDYFNSVLINEIEGIFAWCITGAVKYFEKGVETPKKVLIAGEEYRSEMDIIQQFLDECCDIGDKKEFYITAKELYQVYSKWAIENGINALAGNKLGVKLKEKGIDSKRNNYGINYYGITVKKEFDSDVTEIQGSIYPFNNN